MWASNEAAQKAGNGTHIAIRIDSLRHDEDSDGKLRVDLMVGSLKTTVGMVALPSTGAPNATCENWPSFVRHQSVVTNLEVLHLQIISPSGMSHLPLCSARPHGNR